MKQAVLVTMLFVTLFISGLSSCGDRKNEPGTAAITYYNYLIAGDYQQYVKGMLSCDSLPAEYRVRIETTIKQYLAREKQENGGLKTVELLNDSLSNDGASANVFLDVSFGNGMKEAICLPLVLDKGVWRML
ncbi:MAG: hypothetical protein RR280_04915 [Bacteroidaceae bacterium]